MRFNDTQQQEFDLVIGRAALAEQEGRYAEALETLDDAEAMLLRHNISDEYDWSGWFDLRMVVFAASGDEAAAANTAAAMLARVNATPPDFNAEQQLIIQDSLVEACLVRARYLLRQIAQPARDAELDQVIRYGIRLSENTQRDGDLAEFQELQRKTGLAA
ncbi:MAG TPA: hypothetical protein VEY92_02450 [Pseudoxanthomonas sp.]|nr:hypothetical protein [Pseudoxanthomonas sp.]